MVVYTVQNTIYSSRTNIRCSSGVSGYFVVGKRYNGDSWNGLFHSRSDCTTTPTYCVM